MMARASRRKRSGGNAVVEVALMLPWILFLFVGIFDFGFYSYSAIATQNAARAVALAAATANSTDTDCNVALGELHGLLGLPAVCTALPLTVTTTTLTSATTPKCADCDATICPSPCVAKSILATVTYRTVQFAPIPGVLAGQVTLTRTAEVRITQ
jgi:Flp pilus assembly protein TadG